MLLEIMTPAVVGRAEQTLSWCQQVPGKDLEQVLGVRVGKVTTEVKMEEGQPLALLTVESDLWCKVETGTKVLHTRSRHAEPVPVSLDSPILGKPACQIELAGGPRSTGVRVEGEAIFVDFEATVSLEVTALTRLWVQAHEGPIDSGMDWREVASLSHLHGSH